MSVLAKEIFVVEQELVKAGARDAYQAQLGLAAGAGGAAAFGDVLASAAGGLHHLVVGSGACVYKAVAKVDCAIIDGLGHLKGTELPVTPVRTKGAAFV